jgi:predicted MFS family arabinose efflux permease
MRRTLSRRVRRGQHRLRAVDGLDPLPPRPLPGGVLAARAVSGTTLAVLGTSTTLVAWGVAGFAINPLQQYRVIKLAPCTQNVALSLNASAIYLGQGIGAAIGALVLDYTSLAALGGAGALCTLAALAILFLGTRRPGDRPSDLNSTVLVRWYTFPRRPGRS